MNKHLLSQGTTQCYRDVGEIAKCAKQNISGLASQGDNWDRAIDGVPLAPRDSILVTIGRAINAFVRSVIEFICPFTRRKSVISDNGDIELQVVTTDV